MDARASLRSSLLLSRLLRSRLPSHYRILSDAAALGANPAAVASMIASPLSAGSRSALFSSVAHAAHARVPSRRVMDALGLLGTRVPSRGLAITQGELLRIAKAAAKAAPRDAAAQAHYARLLNDRGQHHEVGRGGRGEE